MRRHQPPHRPPGRIARHVSRARIGRPRGPIQSRQDNPAVRGGIWSKRVANGRGDLVAIPCAARRLPDPEAALLREGQRNPAPDPATGRQQIWAAVRPETNKFLKAQKISKRCSRLERRLPSVSGDRHENLTPALLQSGHKQRFGRFVLRKVTSFAATMGLILATVTTPTHSASVANRDASWVVVHDICVPAYKIIGVGFPCVEVNIADGPDRGFARLRAPSSATRVVVVPTTPIPGIESPELLRENAPNYWEAAWEARRFVEKGARRQLPRDKIGMAINSAISRSQDQLHIHVACVAPAVAGFLRRDQTKFTEPGLPLARPFSGTDRPAMKVETESLGNVNPFSRSRAVFHRASLPCEPTLAVSAPCLPSVMRFV